MKMPQQQQYLQNTMFLDVIKCEEATWDLEDE